MQGFKGTSPSVEKAQKGADFCISLPPGITLHCSDGFDPLHSVLLRSVMLVSWVCLELQLAFTDLSGCCADIFPQNVGVPQGSCPERLHFDFKLLV